MADQKKESSVLFSLRELRGIEDDRIKEEQESARRAEEERIRQQMDAERRVREEQEQIRAAKEEQERLRREEEERVRNHENFRVESAERRAKIEAQAALERERLAKELDERSVEAHKSRPTLLIAAAVGLLIVIVGLGKFLYEQSQETDRQEAAAKARIDQLRTQIDTTLKNIEKLDAERDAKFQELLAAKTEEEKAAAKAAFEQAERRLRAEKEALSRLRRAEEGKKVKPKCKDNDPLCGM